MPSFVDFTFASSTGQNTIRARKCVPDGEAKAVVQIAHGIAEHIERYDGFMAFLASNGYVAVGNSLTNPIEGNGMPADYDDTDIWFTPVFCQ